MCDFGDCKDCKKDAQFKRPEDKFLYTFEEAIRTSIAAELEKWAVKAMLSNEYNFNDTAVRSKTFMFAANVVRGTNGES